MDFVELNKRLKLTAGYSFYITLDNLLFIWSLAFFQQTIYTTIQFRSGMEVKKERSMLKASDVELDMFSDNGLVDLRSLDTNAIIGYLEANIRARDSLIEKKIRQKFEFKQ